MASDTDDGLTGDPGGPGGEAGGRRCGAPQAGRPGSCGRPT